MSQCFGTVQRGGATHETLMFGLRFNVVVIKEKKNY